MERITYALARHCLAELVSLKLASAAGVFAAFALCAAAAAPLPAQTLTTLYSFRSSTHGSLPEGILVQALNGNLYGTTYLGGANSSPFSRQGAGTVFAINPEGTLATLHNFCAQANCADGSNPSAGLVQATQAEFFGTTYSGGTNGVGTVFKITASRELTTVYAFCSQIGCTDGANPRAGLVQAADGNLYGTTTLGGLNNSRCNAAGCGTIFKITPSGTLTTLYSFCSKTSPQGACTDGSFPSGGLVQAANGDLYGTTGAGGDDNGSGYGIVFKITSTGLLTTLHIFCNDGGCLDGASPSDGLVQATDGNFYGTTPEGGSSDGIYSGTVFRITPGGELTTLYNFCSQVSSQGVCEDGATPYAGLVQATDGNLYGTTTIGGIEDGTIFEITPSGAFTSLYNFCSEASSGCSPYAGLVQATNGELYGTTESGGTEGGGTLFSLSLGLGPFVETRPAAGVVGEVIEILGNNMTGATAVSFNGTPALFEVPSSSFILAKVPVGATSGIVQVVTPSGTLSSNVPFRLP
jgi:uncharacterized repeat protein (TIGR03803 family)